MVDFVKQIFIEQSSWIFKKKMNIFQSPPMNIFIEDQQNFKQEGQKRQKLICAGFSKDSEESVLFPEGLKGLESYKLGCL